jgi:long-chain fatty acid transport protein
MRWLRLVIACVGALCAFAVWSGATRAQGIYLPALGAQHTSMGGASTAAAIDALGAMYWNPATISGLSQSEVVLSSGFAFPEIYAGATVLGRGGTTRSDSGVSPLSGTALVYRFAEMPRLTIGQSMALVGGGAVNFPGDPNNPLFRSQFPAAPFPRGLVLGPSLSAMGIYQSTVAASYQATDRLAIAAGPVIDIMTVSFDPALFATPDDANGDGLRTFPSATHTRPFWGAGFKVGAYYHLTPSLDVGFGYSSPQWLETWIAHARNEVGNPETLYLKAQLPAVYSWGLAYKGIDKLTVAVDFRFIDYANAALFGTAPAAGGMGWQNVFATAVGAQYELSERLSARIGYQYNTQVIPSFATLFNVQAPAVGQNMISAGATVRIAENFYSSLTYAYNFRNSVTGSAFQLPGSATTLTASAQSVFIDMTVKFGTPSRYSCSPSPLPDATPIAPNPGTAANASGVALSPDGSASPSVSGIPTSPLPTN